ncbi:hypothetical protein TTHERM_01372840 (macronuclear) [Tetrahymena thermophila SB210]|uniref:Uncharacterized protein n=1 Tax=Tetrahymena thermophila (strain SB210) TaxID=312017 RepID=Q229M5_TETTS|nr:hypothetical protein TTHERM_01372840 [Tetrahymena thermophila SB210]EAR81995.3 hypothetical protein TTHERM_01372840 [Tetrahymena thermophila SB210]|eukprot:XP_001029658.3 hypothetical protein TTHERM_01372840 [Tetrahymena thermophila SB210]
MFQIDISLKSFQGDQAQQKNFILQKFSDIIPISIIPLSENIWQVGFNSEQAKESSLNILKNDESVTIISDFANIDETGEYEIIYKEQEQNAIQEKQEIQNKELKIPQSQQENVAKSSESLQNMSFTSDDDENSKEQSDNNNQQKNSQKMGSSHTVESVQSTEDIKEHIQAYGNNLEATLVQSPLISEEETDDTSQKIYQNISQINVSKEQRNALYSAFNQASSYLKEINKNWVCDEQQKNEDLFNKNILYNPKYQILALGLFSIYIFFL